MIVLGTSIVLTGSPKIHQELGFTDTGLAWVQSIYPLTFGGLLMLALLLLSYQARPPRLPPPSTAST